MKKTIFLSFVAFCFLTPLLLSAQDCDIKNRVQPDGSMLYFIKPEKFYVTTAKSLYGGIATDGENYLLTLIPSPTPPKGVTKKISGALEVTLKGGTVYSLKHFDSQYIQQDTILALLFTIDKKQLPDFEQNTVEQIKLDLAGPEKEVYNLMLHKDAIQQQLNCFLDSKKKKIR